MSAELRRLDAVPLRDRFEWWLAGGRLPDDAGPNAWLGVVQVLTMPLVRELRYPAEAGERLSPAEVDRFLRAVDELFVFLEQRRLMDAHEVLTRRLLLAAALGVSGVSLPDSPFAADRVVAPVVAEVTPERLAEAERLGPVWTTLERAEILRLRHLKQLIRLTLDLREHLTDPALAATVASWQPVFSALP